MASAVYNLLWIAPTFADPYEKIPVEFKKPIPDETLENMTLVATMNPEVDVVLWVDSKRLTRAQLEYFQTFTKGCPSKNMALRDLRDLPEYRRDKFFNTPDASPNWRYKKHSLIWRQVDVAKVLISLQGDYDQTFFCDADYRFKVNSPEVQTPLAKHGIIARGVNIGDSAGYENQMWGFTRERKPLFRKLLEKTKIAADSGENGYRDFLDFMESEVEKPFGIARREITFKPTHDGTQAKHPYLPPPPVSPDTFLVQKMNKILGGGKYAPTLPGFNMNWTITS